MLLGFIGLLRILSWRLCLALLLREVQVLNMCLLVNILTRFRTGGRLRVLVMNVWVMTNCSILNPTDDILDFEVSRVRKLAVVLGGVFVHLEALAHGLIFGVRVDNETTIEMICDGPNVGRSSSQ